MGSGQLPGVHTERSTAPRLIFASLAGALFFPGGKVIDGAKSRDPLNTGDVNVLRAGLVMGKIGASGKFAPSIIGAVTAAVTAAAATLTVSVATGTELDRRVGAGGTFKLVGPTVDGVDDVRSRTLSYSGTAIAGTITLATNAAVAEVQTVTTAYTPDGGTYTLTYKGHTTAAIAWNANAAAIKAALELLPSVNFGDITASAELVNGTTFTFANTLGNVPLITADCSLFLDGAVVIDDLVIAETTPGELAGNVAPGVTCVQTIDATNMAAGDKFVLRLTHPTTGVVYVTAECAGNISTANLETELTNTVGANDIAVSGAVPGGIVITFDDVTHAWANMPVALVEFVVTTAVPTANLRPTVTMTTAGVKGTFPVNSLIMPTDGSEDPVSLMTAEYGTKVTDVDNANIDVQYPKLVIGGQIKAANIINYPIDGIMRRWLKDQLNSAQNGRFIFDDDYALGT